MTLCETFRELSYETWSFMGRARGVSHQPLEETVTDNNIVEIKVRHPSQVITTTYNRNEEAITGADWQWWFTNSAQNSWFGIRVQAKILKFKSKRYEALKYKNQTDILIKDAKKGGLFPLYCFYSNWPLSCSVPTLQCKTFPNAPESYGCTIVDAYTIKSIKGSPKSDSLNSVMTNAFPWSCLVCCSSGVDDSSSVDLPHRVKRYCESVLMSHDVGNQREVPKIIQRPPDHVIAAMQQESTDTLLDDPRLAGLLIFIGDDG